MGSLSKNLIKWAKIILLQGGERIERMIQKRQIDRERISFGYFTMCAQFGLCKNIE